MQGYLVTAQRPGMAAVRLAVRFCLEARPCAKPDPAGKGGGVGESDISKVFSQKYQRPKSSFLFFPPTFHHVQNHSCRHHRTLRIRTQGHPRCRLILRREFVVFQSLNPLPVELVTALHALFFLVKCWNFVVVSVRYFQNLEQSQCLFDFF